MNIIIMYACVINIIVSYVAGEQLITSMKAQSCVARVTSLPSSTIDQSTGEDNSLMLFVYDSGLLFYNVWPLFSCCCLA